MDDQVRNNKLITKDNLPSGELKRYQKTYEPRAIKMNGPFTCATLEGNIARCEDGWLVVDSQGFPYPVDRIEFETTYKLIDSIKG